MNDVDFQNDSAEQTDIDIPVTGCMHCGADLVYVAGQGRWVHTHGRPVDHAPCPYKINPKNWR